MQRIANYLGESGNYSTNEQRTWTDLLFNVGDPETEAASDEMDVLQDAEDYFLTRVGHTQGSPYLFQLSAGGGTSEDG